MARVARRDAENLLIGAAHELFWKFGFKRVTVEDVCKKAGVSKMSFYRYFDNKTDLAKRVLDKVLSDGIEKFRGIMADEDTAANKMHRFIALKIDGTNNISKEFIADIYGDVGSEIQLYMAKLTSQTIASMLEEFRIAQSKGVFNSSFKPELLFAMSNSYIELIKSPALSSLYANPQQMIVELVNLITYGIAPSGAEFSSSRVHAETTSEEKCQKLDG
jgi:AcrR family transcriptional regulator